MKIEQLIGAWRLKSFQISDQTGIRDWRSGANGILIYSQSGYMSVSINSDQSDSPWLDSVLFYAGTFSLNGKTVIHDVTNATDPKRIGTRMLRDAHLEHEHLSLIASGDYGSATLLWEKIS